jgi:transposase-like protein
MCPKCKGSEAHIIRSGFFLRTSYEKGRVQRFKCKLCHVRFSTQTGKLTYRERKPHLTNKVMRLLMEGTSQRGCARTLGTTDKTVQNKLKRLGIRAKDLLNGTDSKKKTEKTVDCIVLDEMETSEHTKCKPISIIIAVEEKTRKVISAEVASMPAKGHLASISLKKYGPRQDERKKILRGVLEGIKEKFKDLKTIKSDECPRYLPLIKSVFENSVEHIRFKGRRGCVVGQGELKRIGFDPLFPLNHTCAMFRDRVKRLTRRTWCTTKKMSFLQCIVHLYAWWHNQLLDGLSGSSIKMA